MDKKLVDELDDIIVLHEAMKNSYLREPPKTYVERSIYSQKHSKVTIFDYKGKDIMVAQSTFCNKEHIFYKMKIYENDKLTKKNITFIKKIKKEMEEAA